MFDRESADRGNILSFVFLAHENTWWTGSDESSTTVKQNIRIIVQAYRTSGLGYSNEYKQVLLRTGPGPIRTVKGKRRRAAF